jgi:hypothetical protein
VAALVIVVLAATAAHAGDRVKLGAEIADRDCTILPGDYVGQGCRFAKTQNQDLEVRTVNAKGKAIYRFRVPASATIDSVLIGWYEPSDVMSCYGRAKKVERSGTRLTVSATSGRHGHVSLCGIGAVIVRFS